MFFNIKFILYLNFFTIFFNLGFTFELTEDLKRGDFWQNIPLTFFYKKTSKDPTLDELTKTAIIESIEEWNKQLNLGPVWYFNNSKTANISNSNIIRWSEDFERETGYTATNTMAITIRYSTPPLLIKAEIILNKEYTSLYHLSNLKLVLMHELGHTIGLDHSNDPVSIMYRSLSLNNNSYQVVTFDDIQGIEQALSHHIEFQLKPLNLNEKSTNKIMNCGSTITKNYLNPAKETKNWQQGMSLFYSIFIGLIPLIFFTIINKLIAQSKNEKFTQNIKPRK